MNIKNRNLHWRMDWEIHSRKKHSSSISSRDLGHFTFYLASPGFSRGQRSDQGTCVGKNGLWTKLRQSFCRRYSKTELTLPQSQEALNVAHTRETLCEQEHSPSLSSDFGIIRHNGCYKTGLISKLPAGQRCQNSVRVPAPSVPHETCRIWSHTVPAPGRYTDLLFQLGSPGPLLHQSKEKGASRLRKASPD